MLPMHISENFPDPKLQALEKPRTLGVSLQLRSRELARDPFQSQVHAELPVFCTNERKKNTSTVKYPRLPNNESWAIKTLHLEYKNIKHSQELFITALKCSGLQWHMTRVCVCVS